jgi:hypothetical protein
VTDLLPSPTPSLFAGRAVQPPAQLPTSLSNLLARVVERLYREFDLLPLSAVIEVVAGCLRDIQGSPPGALPELIERLARQRLSELAPRAAERS